MIIDYFRKQYNIENLGDITWSHAVNNREKLDKFLNDPGIMFIESDLRISPQGEIVCAHPPENESDLAFKLLIEKMSKSKQGLKLDLKDPEVLIPTLEILQQAGLTQPIILNADFLQGNGANISKFSPKAFICLCRKYYPVGILSLGWTTVPDPKFPYTQENVNEMLELCGPLHEITFPVRACLLPNSLAKLEILLSSPGRSLSIWNNEPVSAELATWIKENTDPAKTFYDFIDEDENPLRLW